MLGSRQRDSLSRGSAVSHARGAWCLFVTAVLVLVLFPDQTFAQSPWERAAGNLERTFTGPLGALKLSAKAEGGHYTFVEATTDQMGESRLDRNVKRFFVQLHRADDPSHTLQASY